MIALLANLGQVFLMFLGSNLKRFAKVFDFCHKIGRAIASACKSFECLEGQASDYVFHHGCANQSGISVSNWSATLGRME